MKLNEIYKAGAAFATSLMGMEGLAASIDAAHPALHLVAVALAAITGGATWFVRNKATFDQIIKAIDDDPVLKDAVVETAVIENLDAVEELIRKYRDNI